MYQGNRKYFVKTVSTDKASVEREAKIMSMRWHFDKAEEIGEQLLEEDGEDKYTGEWRNYIH